MNATTLKAQLQQAQIAFWTAECKVNRARTEKARTSWVAKRETLRTEYQQLLAAYAAYVAR